MRIVTIGLGLSILAGTAVFAAEGNPMSGVGISVESSPGGLVTVFDNDAEAQAACKDAGGTWEKAEKGITCNNPLRPLERKGRGIVVGRGGGAFSPTAPSSDGIVAKPVPTATAEPEKPEKPAAKPN